MSWKWFIDDHILFKYANKNLNVKLTWAKFYFVFSIKIKSLQESGGNEDKSVKWILIKNVHENLTCIFIYAPPTMFCDIMLKQPLGE